ncbi:MAG: hypothetical protein V8R55_03485 [Dysosmobacter sp.]
MQVKLRKLAGQISVFGYVGAIVIALAYFVHFVILAGGFGAYFATGWLSILADVMNAVSIAITIIVCAVPEGLPLVIALVLMQNTGKLLKVNVLVRKSIGIETAGSLNILFSDKTGTITKGQLEVVEFFTGDGKVMDAASVPAIQGNLELSIGKNTSAMFDDRHTVVGGNLTDQALLKFLGEEKFNSLRRRTTVRLANIRNSTVPINSVKPICATKGRTFYKGAPERLLANAKTYLNQSQRPEVRTISQDTINAKIDELANRAMRVLAFGYSNQEPGGK